MVIVYLCGGLGVRCKPITDKVPKSLIPVKCGSAPKPIIETSCEAILGSMSDDQRNATVESVLVVADPEYFERSDYKKFESRMINKYGVCFSHLFHDKNLSELYNNWFSVKHAIDAVSMWNLDKLDLMIIEGDVVVRPSAEFSRIVNDTVMSSDPAVLCSYRENEWVVNQTTSGKSFIRKDSTGLALSGISYLPYNILSKLQHALSDLTYYPLRYQEFWDTVFIDSFNNIKFINVGNCIKDFDTVKDLLDDGMISYDNVASIISDDGSFTKLDSMTNTNYRIKYKNKSAVLRLPGSHTEEFIDHTNEIILSDLLVSKYIPTPKTLFINDDGLKITEYVKSCRVSNTEDISNVVALMSKLHRCLSDIDIICGELKFSDLIKEVGIYESQYECSKEFMDTIQYDKISKFYKGFIEANQYNDLVLCHRDYDPRNILVDESGKCYILDFEYSGILSKYWDIACYFSELKLHYNYDNLDEYFKVLNSKYSSHLNKENIELWTGVVDFVWSCWSLAKCGTSGDKEEYGEYLRKRWHNAVSVYDTYCSK